MRSVLLLRLVSSCVVLGIGVALLLRAQLGSDGYSTLINGIALATGIPYAFVNWTLGALLVALAWARRRRPGLGTIAQPLVVGSTVSVTMSVVGAPHDGTARAALLTAAYALLTAGVAGYLQVGLGAGPVEAAAFACDPPLPLRWSYSVIQAGGALVGWALGASVGVGTALVIIGVGPAVQTVLERTSARRAAPALAEP